MEGKSAWVAVYLTEFTHLHVHSDYSLLDGFGRIPGLVDQAIAHKMGSLALTDHGVMFGAIDFYGAAKEHKLNPIIGYEAYVSGGSRTERSGGAFHLTLLAEDYTGYSNLMQLTTKAHLEGFYRKPRVDHELLQKHNQGIICLSGCPSSEISRAILDGNLDEAKKLIDWYHSVYEDRFFLEIQDHGLDFQKGLNQSLIELGRSMGLPIVATNDVHYVRPEDARAQDILVCVQTQTTVNDPKRMKMEGQQFYLKSADEMERLFGHVEGALKNTMAIAARCNLDLDFGRQHLPQPTIPAGRTSVEHLRELCEAGIVERYGRQGEIPSLVRERLDFELGVIKRTGYVDYMLLVNDFIQFAHERGIAIGVRGSAGGSIVAYALRITNVDPIDLGLSFERFLNPERVSMPDIDIDIADDRRQELIQYVTQKFGRDNVAQIISFGTMAARAALRDVGRATNVPLATVDRVAKLIPFNADLGDAINQSAELKALYNDDPDLHQLVDTARELEGVARNASTHAAGVVISAEPLAKHVPLYKVPKADAVTTQYAMAPLEKLGLLKMDFLGLRTLTVVQRAVQVIEETTGVRLELDSIPLDDPETYQLLGRGETFGIFQVDGSGMRRLLREMQPDRFDDIIALIALYRPGPMQFIDDFVKRRNGTNKVSYPHPSVESALADTYGIVVYQEQVVRMVVDIAGFTMGEADLVRKAMAKKQPELLAKYRKSFVEGAVGKGTPVNDADRLFDIIQEFAGYGFNKAHSAAYAVITCQTAYLKAHYPLQYMTGFLSAERENSDKISEALGECRRLDIPILPPSVNHSELDFAIENDGIRFGLGAIKNVGSVAAESVVAERKRNGAYVSVGDLLRRLDWQQVNKRTLEALIMCGALDEVGSRGRLHFNLDRLVAYGSKAARDAASGQVSLFGEAEAESLEPQLDFGSNGDNSTWLRWEKEMIGAYLSHHPLEAAIERLHRLGCRSLSEIDAEADGQTVQVGGILSSVRVFTTRKGEQMATAELADLEGSVDVVIYPRPFRTCQSVVQNENVVVVSGTVGVSDGAAEIKVDSMLPIDSDELVEQDENGGADSLPEPIPFPVRPSRAEPQRSAGPVRLVIDFHRSADRSGDLDRIVTIYNCILRHPGGDCVELNVHSSAKTRRVQLPIDSVHLGQDLQGEIAKAAPEAAMRVEQVGA